jgi:hypothetical protein
MNEHQFGNQIRRILSDGAKIDARIAERLRAAREQALERRKVERAPAQGWALSPGGVIGSFGGFGGFSLRLVLPTLLLVVGLAAIYSWQQDQRAADVEELDAQLLTDDLPIDAYLDRGFEAWLRKVASN